MFAGIGGFREGLTRAGGFVCVGHCELDRNAERSYQDRYRIIQNLPEREGCDYADLAKEKREAARSRAAFSR